TGPGRPISNPMVPLIGPATAATMGSDRLLVLARDTYGYVVALYWTTAGAIPGYDFNLSTVGGPAASPPVIAASGPESALAVWIRPDGTLAYLDLFGFGGGFSDSPGTTNGVFAIDQTPTVVASGEGMYHVFVRDNLGTILYRRYDHGTGWIA